MILTALILAPLAAGLGVFLVPSKRSSWAVPIGTALSLVPLAISGFLFYRFDPGQGGYQMVEKSALYSDWGITWAVGVDGISLGLLLLTTILVPIAIVASARVVDRTRGLVGLILILEAGLLGAFLAIDLFVFFAFSEVLLIPMYFVIGMWGSEKRAHAATKFFLFTAVGSALMLGGIIALGVTSQGQTGAMSLALDDLASLRIGLWDERWLFAVFALAFAIRIPVFPFHTWAVDAYVQAPTPGSILMAGVLSKLGVYGLLRICVGLFPRASVDAAPIMVSLAVVGIIYAATVAIPQTDLKRLLAYSSISLMGFSVLGVFALSQASWQGALAHNVNHGLIIGGLFLLGGSIFERRQTREIKDFGGLAKPMPLMAGFFLLLALAAVGIPGLNGFVGELLILVGAYSTFPVWAIVAVLGGILAAVYLFGAYERVFAGKTTKAANRDLADLDRREVAILTPIALLLLVLGPSPTVFLDNTEASVDQSLGHVEFATAYDVPEPVSLIGVNGPIGGDQ